jgi:hypothetical protein
MNDHSLNTSKALVFVLLFALCAGYVLFQARHLIRGPLLTLATPLTGLVQTDGFLTIEGSTKNTVNLLLSDRKIFVHEDGSFEETIPLPLGYSIITLTAEDRFGRTVATQYEVFRVAEPESPSFVQHARYPSP